jgi:hypothetical protein
MARARTEVGLTFFRSSIMRAMERRIFSLGEARALLPDVKRITAEAVRAAERIAAQLDALRESDPTRDQLGSAFNQVVSEWAERIQQMGLEAKGLWLVDFDNGEGYYCWSYPEESVGHYHGYDEGFAGRMKIV